MPIEPDNNEPGDNDARDVVTEASMDSFPASDPPGWIRSAAATSDDAVPVEPVDVSDLPSELHASSTSGPHLRRLKRLVLASIALGAAALATVVAVRVVRSRRAA